MDFNYLDSEVQKENRGAEAYKQFSIYYKNIFVLFISAQNKLTFPPVFICI